MLRSLLIAALLLCSFLVGNAPAQELLRNELQFSIKDAFWVSSDSAATPSSFAIVYQVKNISETKKVDLQGEFSSELADEFDNQYRAKPQPDGILKDLNVRPKAFPSFYPGDLFEEVLFFEAPVAKASDLTLSLAASSAGSPVNVKLHQELDQDIRTEDISSGAFQGPSGREPLGIAITGMGEGQVVEQGQVFHVSVEVKGWTLPSRITILALDHVLEDNSPQRNNVYDLNIPLDMAPGTHMLNVIAQWPQGKDFTTLSDEVVFHVKDSVPLDLL